MKKPISNICNYMLSEKSKYQGLACSVKILNKNFNWYEKYICLVFLSYMLML